MSNADFILVGIILVLIIIRIVYGMVVQWDILIQIKTEISRSNFEDERKYWRKKLWKTRIKIIPFGCLIMKLGELDNSND